MAVVARLPAWQCDQILPLAGRVRRPRLCAGERAIPGATAAGRPQQRVDSDTTMRSGEPDRIPAYINRAFPDSSLFGLKKKVDVPLRVSTKQHLPKSAVAKQRVASRNHPQRDHAQPPTCRPLNGWYTTNAAGPERFEGVTCPRPHVPNPVVPRRLLCQEM